MQGDILIVLGAQNSPSGKLSTISISRLDYCVKLYSKGIMVLCTGGWGRHFNTSNNAHAIYAKRYLLEKGVSEESFLDNALSANTVDDAVKIKSIISKLEHVNLKIITSDYHLQRVKLIFNKILNEFNLQYFGVKSPLEKADLEPLIDHEQKAIELIMKNGLYF